MIIKVMRGRRWWILRGAMKRGAICWQMPSRSAKSGAFSTSAAARDRNFCRLRKNLAHFVSAWTSRRNSAWSAVKSPRFSDAPEKIIFARSAGENLPFADASFDAVLCRVALPYMHNAQAIAEVSRVLRTGGVYLLKIHAPAFYFGMIRERAKTLSAKQIAYPLICLAGGMFRRITGRQLQNGLWRGKEVFQTRQSLRSELAKNNLRIEKELADTNLQTPSFLIVKDDVKLKVEE